MARDYWVETTTTARPRPATKAPPPLQRAHTTHDGASSNSTAGPRGSTRSARVDFADVTRKEASALRRDNTALKASLRAAEYDRSRLEAELRRCGGEREDALRRLRTVNSRLRDDNDLLRERVGRLEREGGGGGQRRWAEEVRRWKAQCARLDDQAERLCLKMDAVARRNKRLETANESVGRQARELLRDVEYYKAILRRHGFATR